MITWRQAKITLAVMGVAAFAACWHASESRRQHERVIEKAHALSNIVSIIYEHGYQDGLSAATNRKAQP